jgi:hypothetical protein
MLLRMPIIARLPACLLMFIVVVYTLSFCSGRMAVVEGTVAVLLLLPCLWALAVPWTRPADGLTGWFIATLLLLEAWMAGIQLLRAEALPAGWWCFIERAAGVATLALLVGAAPEVRGMVRLLGASAAMAVTVCAILNGWLGLLHPLETDCYGFGHINILANTAGPSLIALVVLLVTDWRTTGRPPLRDLLLAGCGVISLGVITVATERRGVLLGAAAAMLWLLVRWLWVRQRRLAIALVAASALVGALSVLHLFTNTTPGLRAERVSLYRSGLEGVVAGAPWGFGHYGALHLQTVQGEASRHMTANGGYGEDIHNQFLESALDGGPVALFLVLAAIALAAWKAMTISDAGLRLAFQAMGMAILVHLLTDPVYGTEVGVVWLSVVAGMMFAAPARAVLPAPRWLPPLPLLAWPAALLAAAGAASDLRPALQGARSGVQDSYRCLETVLTPQAVCLYSEKLLESEDPWMDLERRKAVLAISTGRMGWTIRTAMFEVDRALRAGEDEASVTAIMRVLDLNPFFKEYYEQLANLLGRHPGCARLVPAATRVRLQYLGGDAKLPRPDIGRPPSGIDGAADLYAAIIWSIANGLPWKDLDGPLQGLCRRYGDIQGVAQLAVMAACTAPEGTFAWLAADAATLGVGLRSPGATINAFALATTPAQARTLLPIAANMYPVFMSDCRLGTMHVVLDPMAVSMRVAFVRLWGLTRLPGPPGTPR